MQAIPEYHGISAGQFINELYPQGKPVVLRQALTHWPLIQAALQSAEDLLRYLQPFDKGSQADVLLLAPQTGGRIFYTEDHQGFNFERRRYPLTAVLAQLLKMQLQPPCLHLALQSARLEHCLPGLEAKLDMPFLPEPATARVWLGNQIQVPAHFDDGHNLACVVAGRRRFMLFAPEQVADLYPGALDFAPTGTPISLVNFNQPDFTRFPNARRALAAAWQAELGPGDLLYIPLLWWHQVQSLDNVSMLLNYWWGGSLQAEAPCPAAFDSLLHTMLSMQHYSVAERQAWAAMFQYFVFAKGIDPCAHLPDNLPALQRLLSSQTGELPAKERLEALRQWLSQQL